MSIESLITFIPPPQTPLENVGDWSQAEAELGCKFPSDFRHYIKRYGSGWLANLHVYNPLTSWGRKFILQALDTNRQLCEAMEITLHLFPESPGLLPWASDSHGHCYCWWTEGLPDEWGIVQIFHGDEENNEVNQGPMTAFLMRFLKNELPQLLGNQPFTPERLIFRPQSWQPRS
jgi:cell wall assembly regulator SMI1